LRTDLAAFRAEAEALAARFRLGQFVEGGLLLEPFLSRLASSWSKDEAALHLEILRAMLECQARCDWLGLADFLEVDIWEVGK
jgi:hypothetical protein